jgi:threonine dehydrogenase-like Zn-dependent dehydrogenase
MKALTVRPGQPNSARVEEVPEPSGGDGDLLIQALAMGVCGTDVEIIAGAYGWAPVGRDRLVLGHESLGRVLEAPTQCGFVPGDLIVGIVRRPDPVPCGYCAVGQWDMCRNGQYTERGIKARDGYGSERFRVESAFAVKVDAGLGSAGVLLEPASVVAKAWAHIDGIGRRSSAWHPRSVLVTGAGPVGLLAALLGTQRGLDVHVFDRVSDGPKPALVRDLGASYHGGEPSVLDTLHPDVIVECTGATPVIADVITRVAPAGVVCLTGVSSTGHTLPVDLGALNRRMVLENTTLFGSVNANRTHYEAAAAALGAADRAWLLRIISRRVPLGSWQDALRRDRDDVKAIIEFEPYA